MLYIYICIKLKKLLNDKKRKAKAKEEAKEEKSCES